MSKTHLKAKSSPVTALQGFLSKAIAAAGQKQQAAFAKMQAKLADNQQPPREDASRDPSIASKTRSTSLAKVREEKGRARSELGKQEEARLNQLVLRKQELMQRLRRIDYELRNPILLPVTVQMSGSRAPLDIPLFRPTDSRARILQQQAYNPSKHEKSIEMLGRLNNQKLRRHEKIVDSMKRKQQLEMDKLVKIQSDKSHLVKAKTKLNPFNHHRQEFSRQGKHQASSQRQQIVTNQFQELPELVTASIGQKVDSFSQL